METPNDANGQRGEGSRKFDGEGLETRHVSSQVRFFSYFFILTNIYIRLDDLRAITVARDASDASRAQVSVFFVFLDAN